MQHPLHRSMSRPGMAGVLGLVITASASAQTDSTTALDRQVDEAFRLVQQQPQDLAQWSRYAQLLIRSGNYEGGVAALERLLLEPNPSPELRVEIALLYFRLASYDMAESMVRQALADDRLQGDKRAVAEALLVNTTQRNKRSQIGGSASFGYRHQSNPTYRSDRDQVLSGGVLGPLAADQRPASDNDFNVGLRLQHQYDLERQNSAAIVSTLGAYVVDYRHTSGRDIQATPTKPYDLQVLDFSTGLQFKPSPAKLPGLTLRPHVLLSDVVAQGHQFLRNAGLGVDMLWRLNERTLIELGANGQHRDFASRADVTDAALLDGRLWSLRARVARETAPGQELAGEYILRHNSTARDYYDYTSHEVRVTYSIIYASPFKDSSYWTTALWVGALRRNYGGPDPAVIATDTRHDREWRLGVNQIVRITPVWNVVLTAEHARNQATLPNFRYKNTSVSASVLRTF